MTDLTVPLSLGITVNPLEISWESVRSPSDSRIDFRKIYKVISIERDSALPGDASSCKGKITVGPCATYSRSAEEKERGGWGTVVPLGAWRTRLSPFRNRIDSDPDESHRSGREIRFKTHPRSVCEEISDMTGITRPKRNGSMRRLQCA